MLFNAVLLYVVGRSGYLARYFYPDTLEVLALTGPLLLFTGLLAGVTCSLPAQLRRPFAVLLVVGGLLCAGSLWLAWFATHFLRSKW